MTHFKEILDIYLYPLCGFLMENVFVLMSPNAILIKNITNEKMRKFENNQ